MKIIIDKRQSGKTTHLINMCYKNNGILVEPIRRMVDCAKHMAYKLGKADIKPPITNAELVHGSMNIIADDNNSKADIKPPITNSELFHRSMKIIADDNNSKYYIDEGQMLIYALLLPIFNHTEEIIIDDSAIRMWNDELNKCEVTDIAGNKKKIHIVVEDE